MRHIGKYRIIGLLGRGGMGQVFKVELPTVGRIMALKLLRPTEHMLDLLGKAEVRRRFLDEARVMAGLRHPHIAQIWDFDEHEGWPFFTMEYACENLGTAIGESYRIEEPTRRIWPDKAMSYLSQILDGLGRLHYAGIVHRDLKPYNILFSDQEHVKIIDFGLSRLRGERSQATPGGMKVGTPFYAAPEQEQDPERAGVPADLYAAGVIFYRMLTGVLPPEGGIRQGRPVFSEQAPAFDLSAPFEGFFRRVLAPAPADRFASALEMRAALEALHVQWRASREQICTLDEAELQALCGVGGVSSRQGAPLRRTPVKTGPVPPTVAFDLDTLARPLHPGRSVFEPLGTELVRDAGNSLLWQASGSPYPLTWEQAQAYVAACNQEQFGGRDTWRLPTVDELCTLARTPEHADSLCLPPAFDQTQRQLWSADRRTFVAAWLLNAGLGFVGWQDFTCPAWVRAVTDLGTEGSGS